MYHHSGRLWALFTGLIKLFLILCHFICYTFILRNSSSVESNDLILYLAIYTTIFEKYVSSLLREINCPARKARETSGRQSLTDARLDRHASLSFGVLYFHLTTTWSFIFRFSIFSYY